MLGIQDSNCYTRCLKLICPELYLYFIHRNIFQHALFEELEFLCSLKTWQNPSGQTTEILPPGVWSSTETSLCKLPRASILLKDLGKFCYSTIEICHKHNASCIYIFKRFLYLTKLLLNTYYDRCCSGYWEWSSYSHIFRVILCWLVRKKIVCFNSMKNLFFSSSFIEK